MSVLVWATLEFVTQQPHQPTTDHMTLSHAPLITCPVFPVDYCSRLNSDCCVFGAMWSLALVLYDYYFVQFILCLIKILPLCSSPPHCGMFMEIFFFLV